MPNWPELEKKYYMPTFKRLPVVLVRGEGMKVWDADGKEYLDFFAGLGVNVLGHCHPVIVEAINAQSHLLIQTSNLFYTIPQLQLAELLAKHSCMDKAFFCNSGAEANEGAIKLARKHGRIHLGGAFEIITVTGSFHGRTMATIAATGQTKFQTPFVPLPGGFINVLFDNLDAIKAATSKSTCAVMLEPIQGEGGVNLSSPGYFSKVREWCDKNNLLLILDEIQTGMGRTGTLFAYEHLGIEPDVMTLAKGLGGGIPIGAILAKDKASVFNAGEHGSTFGGNPLACAVGYATVKFILENKVLENVQSVGNYLEAELLKLKARLGCIRQVRGRGFLWAVQLDREAAGGVVLACLERGLLVNAVKPDAIRFIPPLVTQRSDVDQAMRIFEDALKGIEQNRCDKAS